MIAKSKTASRSYHSIAYIFKYPSKSTYISAAHVLISSGIEIEMRLYTIEYHEEQRESNISTCVLLPSSMDGTFTRDAIGIPQKVAEHLSDMCTAITEHVLNYHPRRHGDGAGRMRVSHRHVCCCHRAWAALPPSTPSRYRWNSVSVSATCTLLPQSMDGASTDNAME